MKIIYITDAHPRFETKYSCVEEIINFNKKTIPEAEFHYISNTDLRMDGVSHHPLSEYICEDIKKYQDNFFNMSANPSDLERLYLQRFLVLRNFINAQQWKSFLHLDNDIAIFRNPSYWPTEVLSADYTLSKGHSCQFMIFNTKKVINDFFDYVMGIYIDRNSEFKRLLNVYNSNFKGKKKGGIGDMFLWSEFKNLSNLNCIEDTSQIFNNNQTFDHHLQAIDGYEKEGFIKKIEFKKRIPYSFHQETKKRITFNTLHFQGTEPKLLISDFLNRAERSND